MEPTALAGQITQLDQGYDPVANYNKITTQLGIPDARTRVQALQSNLLNTENAIKSVDPNVTARTSNSLVTEAQRGRLVDMEKAPLTQTYSDQNQAYGTEQGNLNALTSQADTQAGLADTAYKTKRQSLADQLTFAQKQQSDAESKREFDVQQAASSAKAGAASTAAPTKNDASNHIISQFTANKGKDGYVSNETWANALDDWNSVGGTSRDFYKLFDRYVNPKFKTSYAGWNQR